MEGPYHVPGGEPQKVRNRKPKPRNNLTVDANNQASSQGMQRQPPPIRKSTLVAQPQQQQPEAANWEAYNQGTEEYGNPHPAQYYPEPHGHGGEHVDAHGYGYGSVQGDAGQEYTDHGGTHVDAGQGYNHGSAHVDPNVDAGQHYDHGGAHVDAGQGHGHGHNNDNGYGGAQAGAGQDYSNGGTQGESHEYVSVAPTQKVKTKRSRNPRSVADGVHQGGYENQHQQTGDAYGHGYDYPEAYNAVPEQQPNRNPRGPKREPRHRKGDREGALAPRAISCNPDAEGSRSRTSQEGSDSNRSGNNRAPPPPAARPSLDEWMKKQAELAGPKPRQDESMIVFDDHDKSELETRMFGAPLAMKKLPPVVELVMPPEATPQYHQQPRGQPRENPLYEQPVQRWPDANSPMPLAYRDEATDAGPSAKCMACVHGVGVPVATLATRCACRYCCTIL